MKRIGALLILLALAFVNVGCFYRALQPNHPIQAGQIIRNKDLGYVKVWPKGDSITDRNQIVGHRALVFLNGGTRIKPEQVDAKQSSFASDLWEPEDPNDHSYIHNR